MLLCPNDAETAVLAETVGLDNDLMAMLVLFPQSSVHDITNKHSVTTTHGLICALLSYLTSCIDLIDC